MDIFARAGNLPPAERSALLQAECGSDLDLRELVRRLLKADQKLSADSSTISQLLGNELSGLELRGDQIGPELLSSRMIGTTISHYRIEAELGRGGMGVVFQAYDTHLQRRVAIKILTEGLASLGGAGSAVLAEARAASALNHPSIVTIYEVGEHNGKHFIVMELLSGTNLRSVLNAKSLELKAVFRIGAQIAEALYAAHSEGVIHGDVKPENVMLLSNGQVKLLDFGIARQFSLTANTMSLPSENIRDPDQCRGFAATLAYAAPETLRSSRIDHRADFFSLGVLLFELATGSRPFDAPSPAALIEQILHQPAPNLMHSTDGPGTGLGEVVKRLLAKDPEARYQSAHEIQVEIAVAQREFEFGLILPSSQGNKRSLAVLPFRLLTPDPHSEFLCVALADALINQLGSHREIIVRPTNSILRYANRTMDPLLAARELNTNICVEGSIQKVGSRIRVHVQVWDTGNRRSLSSAKHDADDTELFLLQDSMADNVASVLGLALKPATGQPPTNNPIAYELFLRAAACLSRYSRWEVRSAITILDEATRLDPQFADAWAQLADACMRMFTLFEPRKHWLRQADHAVNRCLAVNPGNADGYCVHARIQWSPPRFHIPNALRSITTALRLNPGCRQAQFWNGMYLFHVGLHEEANRAISAALAVDPEDPLALFGIGHVALYSWDFETAYKYHSRALTTDPSNLYAALFFPAVPLYTGDLKDAEDKIKFAREIAPANPMVSSWEALLFAKRGDAKRAEAASQSAARSKQLFTYSHHVAHTVASAYAILGKTDAAVTWLRRASETGFPHYPVFRDDPHLTSLRTVPEYRRLLSGLKRQWVAFKREFGHGEKSDG
jgi:serine/threonine protein kinase/tetratricopeptide (TPR) repeat protein